MKQLLVTDGITLFKFEGTNFKMKKLALNILCLIIALGFAVLVFYNYRALHYWGKVTTGVITDCEFVEVEYEGRNKVVAREELGIEYTFKALIHQTTIESKNTISGEDVYYLLEEYFLEEIDNDSDFYHSFYENPPAYLVGKKIKIRYLESNPKKNLLNIFYEEKSILGDLILFIGTFLTALFTLLVITQVLSDKKQRTI